MLSAQASLVIDTEQEAKYFWTGEIRLRGVLSRIGKISLVARGFRKGTYVGPNARGEVRFLPDSHFTNGEKDVFFRLIVQDPYKKSNEGLVIRERRTTPETFERVGYMKMGFRDPHVLPVSDVEEKAIIIV